ncbi:Glu-tRNA(Gln) amidotransferase GatDE subunit D [Candidatus Woesearchaeota archaeon]|nr:Glu-tRNA(Gln) amidotransferase GatDE subunit D [Candidatus Woesearchaeota archaeon]
MQPGDRVAVVTEQEELEGTLMPEQQGYFVLKLDTGYNLAFKKKTIKKVDVVQPRQAQKDAKEKIKQQKGLPTISILHTGGTVASKVDYKTGGVISRFTPEEVLDMFPDLKEIANINSRLLRNMWSGDMRTEHHNLIAEEVAKELNKTDGVIITHGTDTLHYTAAALSFILQKLSKPVIVVGCQRSSDRASTDAGLNLQAAAQIIAQTKWTGVGICMHENENDDVCVLLPGAQTRKMHSSRRDAFKPINAQPIARIRPKNKSITFTTELSPGSKAAIEVKPIKPLKVGMLYTYPGITSKEIQNYKGYDGLVLVGTGLGHFPVDKIDEFTEENEKVWQAIKDLAKDTVLCMSTQTIYGETNMNVYQYGRRLQEAGVTGVTHSMPPETAWVKLCWLLSHHAKDEAKKLFTINLVGEIPPRL